ncbi:transposable element Tc1 transposase [Trichonephila clavipes]|nr:transposable element Tc1 transposase [Trichonephila clavipes]
MMVIAYRVHLRKCDRWSLRDGTASKRSSSGWPHDTTEREDHRIRCTAGASRIESAAKFRSAVGTTVTQRTIRNRLLQGHLRTRRPVMCVPFCKPLSLATPLMSSQSSLEERMEICCVFSDKIKFDLGAINGCVLARRRPWKCLQPNFL